MNGARGSLPALVAIALAFATAFVWQRQRSTFLAIERETPTAQRIAEATGLPPAEVLALADLLRGPLDEAAWRTAAERFAPLRAELGAPLAAVALAGGDDEAAVRAAFAAAGGRAEPAWRSFRLEPRALAGLRFVAMTDRFGERIAARH